MPMRAYMDVFTACLGDYFGADICGGGIAKSQINRKYLCKDQSFDALLPNILSAKVFLSHSYAICFAAR